MKTFITITRYMAYTIIGVVFILAVWSFMSSRYHLPLSLQFFAVESGSMEPAIKTGSIVITLSQSNYYPGTVITYFSNTIRKVVTHRIYAIKKEQGRDMIITKGDANKTVDPVAIHSKDIIGKVIWSIPLVGRLVLSVKTIPGLIGFIIIPSTIIIYSEIVSLCRQIQIGIKKRRTKQEITFIHRSYVV